MTDPNRVSGTLSVMDAASPATLRRAADLCAGFDVVPADVLLWAAKLSSEADAFMNQRSKVNR